VPPLPFNPFKIVQNHAIFMLLSGEIAIGVQTMSDAGRRHLLAPRLDDVFILNRQDRLVVLGEERYMD
jgi:hypothetical protein